MIDKDKIVLNHNPDYTDKIRRIRDWINGISRNPFKMIIIPTNRCNLNCFSCPNSLSRSKGVFNKEDEISDDNWLKLVGEALDYGVKEYYILGGGEPLLRKDLVVNILKRIKTFNKNYICEIITNGTLLTDEVAEALVKWELDKILVSIDGPDNETHDYLRGFKGAFRNITQNLSLLKKYKEDFGKEKPIVQMNTVLSNRTYNLLQEIVMFAHKHGIKEVALHPMREYAEMNPEAKRFNLNEEQNKILQESIEKAEMLSNNLGIFLNKDMVEETNQIISKENGSSSMKSRRKIKNKYDTATCYEPLYSILIDPIGNANYCCPAGDGVKENNVFKYGFMNVWNSDYFNHIRKLIIDGKTTKNCQNCGLLDMTARLRKDLQKFEKLLKS